MNRAILLFLIATLTCFAADPEQATPSELRDLIRGLPTRDRVVADVALYKSSLPGSAQQREAVERLKKAKEGFDRLKTFLRPGTSFSTLPGIFTLAPHHRSDDGTVSMVLGIPPGWNWRRGQGNNENEYDIIFDSKGVILELRDVVYKH